jgi:hypothetical protein
MASRPWSRPALAVAAALLAALSVAGCVSIPSAGPVQSYPVTQGPNAQAQPYVQIVPGPPRPGWSPKEVVEGFLAASASFSDNEQVARRYLTRQGSEEWNPSWSAVVYKDGPNVSNPTFSPAPKPTPTVKVSPSPSHTPTAKASTPPQTATVTISGKVQAQLSAYGSYAYASSSEPAILPSFQLVKVPGGQWRISHAWPQLLLTADSFTNDYQLRNLYFFDPQTRYLVPDPVYVPFQQTSADLMDGLVNDLITQPKDWLASGATKTAIPLGTKLIGDVTLDGVTAVVNLGGTITRAPNSVMEQLSGQLLRTLIGAGQGGQAVQSIEVLRNGKPWIPPWSPDNPIQSTSKYSPASGASATSTFYFLGSGGMLFSQHGAHGKPVEIERLGATFDQIAVSPDGQYLAAVTTGGALYTGLFGGVLAKRAGTGYTSVSWDRNDDLWATENTQIVVLLRNDRLVPVTGASGLPTTGVTALEVAPDGVRVAMIIGDEAGDETLDFGAISWQEGPRQGEPAAQIKFSPFYVPSLVPFQAVTWYGADNVIALANPGSSPSLTEYPVNGGNSTAIPAVPGMESISASSGSPLIAGLPHGHMEIDPSLTGTWAPLPTAGTSPVYPG